MAVASGLITGVTSAAPVKICTMGEGGALVTGSVTGTFVGGPAVAASGANTGIPVPATPSVLFVPGARTIPSVAVPSGADNTCDLYAIATGAVNASVTYLAPQGG